MNVFVLTVNYRDFDDYQNLAGVTEVLGVYQHLEDAVDEMEARISRTSHRQKVYHDDTYDLVVEYTGEEGFGDFADRYFIEELPLL